MQAHADAQGALGELRLCFGGSASRLTGVGEDDEEGIALRVNLEPAVAGESRAQDPVVLGERLHIAGPELLEQPRRALDVSEEQGDGSDGKLGHPAMMRHVASEFERRRGH
jgi:hypothetical protein